MSRRPSASGRTQSTAVAFNPNGGYAYVTNGSATSTVSVIDTSSYAITATITVGVRSDLHRRQLDRHLRRRDQLLNAKRVGDRPVQQHGDRDDYRRRGALDIAINRAGTYVYALSPDGTQEWCR